MDNLRLILIFALVFVVLMLWQAWQEDYETGPVVAGAEAQQVGLQEVMVPTPQPTAVETGVPEAPVVAGNETPETPVVPEVSAKTPTIRVVTDFFDAEIDTRGGTIRNLYLQEYPVSLQDQEKKFQLLKGELPSLFMAQSGLVGSEKELAPTHEALFQVERREYRMEDGQDSLTVDLVWRHVDGIQVTKRFVFTRGSYAVEVHHLVENLTGSPWTGREYRQLQRSPEDEGKMSAFMYTYTGGAIYSQEEKYEKISFSDMEDSKLSREVKDGWVAMLQHYFIGAWVSPAEETDHFYTNVLPDSRYVIGAYTPSITVASGASHRFSSTFVAGPKRQNELKAIAPGLELTVDYGWLTVLAQPIFWLLGKIYSLLGNWGWSIILLTMMIKLAFYKLSETSYKSMANMRRMTPRIQALKDRYGDDKSRMNQAMMEMYKKEKINPLGGCLPIIVQIPVFIALYWVLLESVELRQAPFIFWLTDLSVKDPYFVLPLIMGVSMFIQQKLNPAPPDPMQAKIMMSLPFVFTIFFAFFPAGLVLYWVVNNILSITQQWYITMQIEKAAAHKHTG